LHQPLPQIRLIPVVTSVSAAIYKALQIVKIPSQVILLVNFLRDVSSINKSYFHSVFNGIVSVPDFVHIFFTLILARDELSAPVKIMLNYGKNHPAFTSHIASLLFQTLFEFINNYFETSAPAQLYHCRSLSICFCLFHYSPTLFYNILTQNPSVANTFVDILYHNFVIYTTQNTGRSVFSYGIFLFFLF
jgi:hypothetical protein